MYAFNGENKNPSSSDIIEEWAVKDSSQNRSLIFRVLLRACASTNGSGSPNNPPGGTPPVTAGTKISVIPTNNKGSVLSAFDSITYVVCGDAAQAASCYGSTTCVPKRKILTQFRGDGSIDLPVDQCSQLGQDVWCHNMQSNMQSRPVSLSSLSNGSKFECSTDNETDIDHAPAGTWAFGKAMQKGKVYFGEWYINGPNFAFNYDYYNNGPMEVMCGNSSYNTLIIEGQTTAGSINENSDLTVRPLYFDTTGTTRFRPALCGDKNRGGGKVWAVCYRPHPQSYTVLMAEVKSVMTVEEFVNGKVVRCD